MEQLIQPKVYLAGPIAHLTYKEAVEWRHTATKRFAEVGIIAYSPMRAKERILFEGRIGTQEYNHILASDSGIVNRDRRDVFNCDLMLVNLVAAPKVSVGTPVEFGWANAWDKPIVTVMEKEDSVYDHPFIRRLTGFRVETLEAGIDVAIAILLP